jgi:hypothetical protein
MSKIFINYVLEWSDLFLVDQIFQSDLAEGFYGDDGFLGFIQKIKESFHFLVNKGDPSRVSESVFQSLLKWVAKPNLSTPFDSALPSFFKDLGLYVIDSDAKGNKKEAVNRMIAAFLNRQSRLDLKGLNLNKIPKVIGKLIRLEELLLSQNKLESIPKEIGQLTNLRTLFVEFNRIESLPNEIGGLSQLEELWCQSNRLHSIPNEIGQLTSLRFLFLDENNLRSIPDSIERLSGLEILSVHYNNLESIRPSIGHLLSLTHLALHHNRNLTDLPMSLGNISGLSELDISSTRIPQQIVDAILEQSREMRNEGSVQVLPLRLIKWQTLAKSSSPIEISSLNETEKKTLNEWLFRLEKTKDFSTKEQARLASVVLDLLKDLMRNPSFKELFFNQVEANNEACEDRAAMSLNELFTSWKIICLPKTATLKEKIEIMTQAAKTNSLRNRLNQLIAEEENKKSEVKIRELQAKGENITPQLRAKIRRESEEKESVEIYLNYESLLKQRLNLLSVIETMSYRAIGARSWIDKEELVGYVNKNFYEELIKLPLFEEFFKGENREPLEKIQEAFMKKLIDLGECPKGLDTDEEVLNFNFKQGELVRALEKEKKALAIEWYKKITGSKCVNGNFHAEFYDL